MTTQDSLIKSISPNSSWYIVLRPFSGERDYVRGEVVDTATWRSTASLSEGRFIVPLPYGVEVPKLNKDGVRIINGKQSDEELEKKISKTKPMVD